jgi:hypothetical protein
MPILRVPAGNWSGFSYPQGNLLFDMTDDPGQNVPLQNKSVESRMMEFMRQIMEENDAPQEYFSYLGLR